MSRAPRTTAEAPADSREVVVRETTCKTILNRSSISDYTLNCYTGCEHACVYCYARFMQRFHPHPEPWGRFVDVKVNAVETLQRQLRRAEPGSVFVSSACDGWQPIEAQRRLTRRCCQLLVEHGFQVNVLTKSALVLGDLDVFSGHGVSVHSVSGHGGLGGSVRIGVTVTTLDEPLARLWEPGCASVEERFRVIQEARRAGLRTGIMFGPLLPYLSDSQSSIEALFRRAADLKIDVIWVDALNPRPKVWPSVAGLLRQHFPDLHERYRRVLFDRQARAAYTEQVRNRVARAARRFGLTDRVAGCV